MKLEDHIRRMMAFSRATYGPGRRTEGVLQHLEQEIQEVRNAETDEERIKEWVDLVILSLDGLWREIYESDVEFYSKNFSSTAEQIAWEGTPDEVVEYLMKKQTKNELREWPNWRDVPQDQSINHVEGVQD